MILATIGFSQQINHTSGTNLAGALYTTGLSTFIDTTAGTTNYFYVDLDDFYYVDYNPLVVSDVLTVTGSSANDSAGVDSIYGATVATVNISSNLQYLGTIYVSFDNQGAAPTADSLGGYVINVTPGVYTNQSTKSLATADWGAAITLETVRQINDYFAINNVYVHATKYKLIPPQVLRFGINAPSANSGMDDSTMVYWDYAYPAIYHTHEVQKP